MIYVLFVRDRVAVVVGAMAVVVLLIVFEFFRVDSILVFPALDADLDERMVLLYCSSSLFCCNSIALVSSPFSVFSSSSSEER